MSRAIVSLRSAAVAVPVFFLVVACSPLQQAATEQAIGGWYMQLQVNPDAARSITVSHGDGERSRSGTPGRAPAHDYLGRKDVPRTDRVPAQELDSTRSM